MDSIGIGIAGFGTVGAGVYKNLVANGSLISQRLGCTFDVRRVAVRDLEKPRSVEVPRELLTTDLDALVADSEIQVVVELIGGTDRALEFVLAAIAAGKIVVTGNKALLAEHGPEIFAQARKHEVPVFYEAAVAGGIPIIKAVREAFVGNHFESIHGILNGTSNYILSRMANEAGLEFDVALKEATALGYAEADPTLDVNGWDAAHKAIILASLAYGFWIKPDDIYVDGIESVTAQDMQFADSLGYLIKLLATIRPNKDGLIEVRVCPTLIPKAHVLSSVHGVFNAIWLRGDVVGDSLFYGRGAGQDPTASSVIGDLAECAVALRSKRKCFGFTAHGLYGNCLPLGDSVSQFYLRLTVDDTPGVLAQIAGILGSNGIGISSVIQPESHDPGPLPLVLMIHDAQESRMREAVTRIASLACVHGEPTLFYVESFA